MKFFKDVCVDFLVLDEDQITKSPEFYQKRRDAKDDRKHERLYNPETKAGTNGKRRLKNYHKVISNIFKDQK